MPTMHPYRRTRLVLLALCGWTVFTSSSSARVLPTDIAPLVERGYAPTDPDERGLWLACDTLEERLAASNLRVDDAVLTAYVRQVTERLLGDVASDLRIYIVRSPDFNASMAPNGLMIVHTGLLARLRSEAQLAAVLGHEAGHYLRRHSVQGWRSHKTKTAVMSFVALGGAVASASTGHNWYDLANSINNVLLLSIFSFSREQEAEADAYGIALLRRTSYPTTAAGEVWRQVIAERQASAAARDKRYRDASRSAFSTHPPSDARMNDLIETAATLDAAGLQSAHQDDGQAAWSLAISEVRPALIEEQIKLNDPGASHYLLASLAHDGWDSALRYYEGEVYRLRDEPGDADLAAQAYAAAVAYEEVLPEAYRAHGYAQLKAGNAEEGRRALGRYLELRPDAADAEMVRFSIGN
jgi:beta-barrel assembly-enhancing protease